MSARRRARKRWWIPGRPAGWSPARQRRESAPGRALLHDPTVILCLEAFRPSPGAFPEDQPHYKICRPWFDRPDGHTDPASPSGGATPAVRSEQRAQPVRHDLEFPLVVGRERGRTVAVEVELAPHRAGRIADENHDLRTGADAAGNVIVEFADVGDIDVAVLRDGGAAYPLSDRDPRVLRGGSNVVVELELVPFEQVDAYPVVTIRSFLDADDGLAQERTPRSARVPALAQPRDQRAAVEPPANDCLDCRSPRAPVRRTPSPATRRRGAG